MGSAQTNRISRSLNHRRSNADDRAEAPNEVETQSVCCRSSSAGDHVMRQACFGRKIDFPFENLMHSIPTTPVRPRLCVELPLLACRTTRSAVRQMILEIMENFFSPVAEKRRETRKEQKRGAEKKSIANTNRVGTCFSFSAFFLLFSSKRP